MRWKNVRIIYTAWSVQIRSYFWSVFPRIRTEYGEIYLSLRIQSECGKMRTRNNSVFGHFSGSDKTEVIVSIHPPVNLCLRALQKLSFSWSAFYKYFRNHTSDALRDLVPFVHFKKHEKHPWCFYRLLACNFTETNTHSCVFLTFFKRTGRTKWYAISLKHDED